MTKLTSRSTFNIGTPQSAASDYDQYFWVADEIVGDGGWIGLTQVDASDGSKINIFDSTDAVDPTNNSVEGVLTDEWTNSVVYWDGALYILVYEDSTLPIPSDHLDSGRISIYKGTTADYVTWTWTRVMTEIAGTAWDAWYAGALTLLTDKVVLASVKSETGVDIRQAMIYSRISNLDGSAFGGETQANHNNDATFFDPDGGSVTLNFYNHYGSDDTTRIFQMVHILWVKGPGVRSQNVQAVLEWSSGMYDEKIFYKDDDGTITGQTWLNDAQYTPKRSGLGIAGLHWFGTQYYKLSPLSTAVPTAITNFSDIELAFTGGFPAGKNYGIRNVTNRKRLHEWQTGFGDYHATEFEQWAEGQNLEGKWFRLSGPNGNYSTWVLDPDETGSTLYSCILNNGCHAFFSDLQEQDYGPANFDFEWPKFAHAWQSAEWLTTGAPAGVGAGSILFEPLSPTDSYAEGNFWNVELTVDFDFRFYFFADHAYGQITGTDPALEVDIVFTSAGTQNFVVVTHDDVDLAGGFIDWTLHTIDLTTYFGDTIESIRFTSPAQSTQFSVAIDEMCLVIGAPIVMTGDGELWVGSHTVAWTKRADIPYHITNPDCLDAEGKVSDPAGDEIVVVCKDPGAGNEVSHRITGVNLDQVENFTDNHDVNRVYGINIINKGATT